MPALTWIVVVGLACLTATSWARKGEERILYNTKATRDPSKLNVHVVCHSHDDAGWLKTWDQYYYGARQDIQTAGLQFVISSVVQALRDNPDRRFAYGEMSFFTKWWAYQNDETRDLVKQLVREGRLDFVNGGFVQHDEAAAHYVAMIDQTTRGHRFLNETFGKTVKVGWQLDPFGHSSTQAALLSAAVGFEGLFFGRADYQDIDIRRRENKMDMIWRASQSWGDSADIFTHNNYDGNYGPPPGGYFYEWGSQDPPIIDDPESPDYNVKERVEWFVDVALAQATQTRGGRDILFLEGTDFTYANANTWYINLDRLIHYANLDGRINVFYSTPAAFIEAKKTYPPSVQWPLKTDDFFPYADCPDCYWTGYFTSRPTSKAYIRSSTSLLQACRQLAALTGLPEAEPALDALEKAVSVTQHHDSITGTERQAVANDYHRLLHKGRTACGAFIGKALLHLLFPPAPTPTSTPSLPTQKLSRRLAAATTSTFTSLLHPFSTHRTHPHATEPTSTTTPTTTDSSQTTPPTTAPPAISLELCPYLNASICDVTVKATAKGRGLMVVVYNPVAWPRRHHVRVPIGAGPYTFNVEDSDGNSVDAQVLPVLEATIQLQQALLVTGEAPDLAAVAPQAIAFSTALPPLGYKTFYVRATSAPTPPPSPSVEAIEPSSSNDGLLEVANEHLRLTYNTTTGRLLSIGSVNSTFDLPVQHSLLWYHGSNGSEASSPGLGSGAYIFRLSPTMQSPFEIAGSDPVKLHVVRGPLVTEVHQTFSPWAHMTTRLWAGEGHVEAEWTVGPIPSEDMVAREVVSRWTTPLQSAGAIYTDSNGREMLKRIRNFRPSWNLTVTQPVTGNFYPITSAASITDGKLGLTVITDRSQGAASLVDGQMELMVHRRCVGEDQRGVGEALNETQCYCRECNCMGLIARGTHLVLLHPEPWSRAASRYLQVLHNDPPVVAFGALPLPTDEKGSGEAAEGTSKVEDVLKGARGTFSGLKDLGGLAKNVHLVSLMPLEDNRLLVRLAHNLQVGEHPELSLPAKVDLSQLLAGFQISSINELSLTANQYKAQMPKPHKWTVEPTAQPLDGTPNLPQYDINNHNDTLPVIELYPMEIRTFEINIA